MNFKNMGQDEKKDWIETFVGGACGVIAIIAAVVEYVLGDNGAFAGMFKDIFGTLVVVFLFVAAMPKRKPKDLDNILKEEVEKWGLDNAPLIFKAENYQTASGSSFVQGFVLLQDPTKYPSLVGIVPESEEWHRFAKAGKENKTTGKFLSLPAYSAMVSDSFKVTFTMGQTHFKKKENMTDVFNDIVRAIRTKYNGYVDIKPMQSSLEIDMTYKAIQTKEDVEQFVNSIDFVLSLVKVIA